MTPPDVLTTGPERPRRTGRRSLRVAVAVLVAGVAAVLARTGTDGPRPDRAQPSTATAVTPPEPSPPYDRLPGRTPIPAPAQTESKVSGLLPAVGPPSRAAAGRATDLVLGRYCADPARYTYTLGPDPLPGGDGWGDVRVLVFGLDGSGGGPVLDLALRWTGTGYRWTGSLLVLAGC